MSKKTAPIPANWPFPTWLGKPIPKRRVKRAPRPVLPDAPF